MRIPRGNGFLVLVIVIIILQVLAIGLLLKLSNKGQGNTPPPTNSPNITNPAQPTTTVAPSTTPEATEQPKPDRKAVSVSRGGYDFRDRAIDKFEGCITMYTEEFKSCGKYPSHPEYGITASGKRVKANHTVAMGKRFPFGTLIMIEGFGDTIFECEDRGGAITGNDVDVYIPGKPNGEELAEQWGVQYKQVWVLRYGKGDGNGEHTLHQLQEQDGHENVPVLR